MLGLIAAALAIDGQCGGAFLKWPPEGIHTGHGQGNGLDNSFGAPLLVFLLGMEIGFGHTSSQM
jgi:hypothetical protein